MARVHVTLCAVLALWAPALQAQQAAVPPQPLEVAGAMSRVYKSVNGSELRLHIFNPQKRDAAALPAIVFFFGGAWTNGSVNQFIPQSKHLAGRGMVAVVADYRVFGRHQTSAFEAMADAKSAIRWVRAHATELGIDPNRIAAGGGSAGGHIALSAAVFDRFDEVNEDRVVSSRPDALVLFNPAVDTSPDYPERSAPARQAMARFGDRGKEGSPVHHVGPGLPPTLILHGRLDTTVPFADVERYCAEATKRGNQCRLVGYDGAAHGFFNPGVADGKWHRESLLEADRFLTGLGYLRGPVPTQIQ